MATIFPFSQSASRPHHHRNRSFSPCISPYSYRLLFAPTYIQIYKATVLNSNPTSSNLFPNLICCHHLPTFGGYAARVRSVSFDAALYLLCYRRIVLHGGMHSSHVCDQPWATAPGASQQVNHTQAVPVLSRLQFLRSNTDDLNERDLFSTIRKCDKDSSSIFKHISLIVFI